MSNEHSVSQFIDGLKKGEEPAAQVIWERFYNNLLTLADRKLKSSPRKAMDQEDVVQNAFIDFFVQTRQGRFPKLDDRDDLWQILAMLVDRRAKDQIKFQNTQKAGGGKVRTESVFMTAENSIGENGIGQIEGLVPTPQLAFEFIEVMDGRLAGLSDDHRKVALLKLQGYSNAEIADLLHSSNRTIERWLKSIREQWQANGSEDEF